MSEVVVRMEMPKNCPCELSAEVFDPSGNYGGHQPCFAWYGIPARSKEFDRCVVRSERPAWCPIVGVLPEQHDRLVSEKAVRWAIDDIVLEIASRTGRVAMTKNEAMEYVKRLPTIIAAERKDDE